MKDYVTKDFLRAELSEIRTEMRTGFSDIRAEFSNVRAEMSQLSENLTNRLNGMMLKMILGILIPILTLMLGLYFKN
ncbi:hypothetical protein [Arachidicoccus terrestris]|uniref:hypothetical protein n=1 Tax=Arachidicoccus terrestris TaxID=2875539 RepID=UPI001CC803F8|nr:hypothetical protein [Arachidicoccus terrestris]UAY53883.1 hypothetical protein K9M52_10355 [Arachidicoccus terrestris]